MCVAFEFVLGVEPVGQLARPQLRQRLVAGSRDRLQCLRGGRDDEGERGLSVSLPEGGEEDCVECGGGTQQERDQRALGRDVRDRLEIEGLRNKGVGVVAQEQPPAEDERHRRRRGGRVRPASPPDGSRAPAWLGGKDEVGGGGRGRKPGAVERRLRERAPEGGEQLRRRARHFGQAERGHRPRRLRCVPRRTAVGDDRAASNERLQAGHAAGGVHDRVGGRQQLAHLLGEAEHAHARLAREQGGQPCPQRFVSGRQADDRRPRQPQAGPGGALEIADAPAAAGDDDDRPLERQPERASRLHLGARREERRGDQRPH